ncbi:hypothetical protein, partial [Klebsiella pneumoniae]|uniref:hypothetical protein n=1 Tax=Klebsiella pneumoniae TaxID=573 RepID=UPI003851873B
HLQLDALGALTVANIADGDTVDLSGITVASATITGNTVLLTTGTGQTATLTSVSSLAGLAAQVSGDGHDGSLITFT